MGAVDGIATVNISQRYRGASERTDWCTSCSAQKSSKQLTNSLTHPPTEWASTKHTRWCTARSADPKGGCRAQQARMLRRSPPGALRSEEKVRACRRPSAGGPVPAAQCRRPRQQQQHECKSTRVSAQARLGVHRHGYPRVPDALLLQCARHRGLRRPKINGNNPKHTSKWARAMRCRQ